MLRTAPGKAAQRGPENEWHDMLAGTGLHCEEPIERGLSWLFGGQNYDVNFSGNLSSPTQLQGIPILG